MGYTQLAGRGLLNRGYLLPEDELLRLKHVSDCCQQLLLERLVLALKVKHRHGLGGCSGGAWRDCSVLHASILAMAGSRLSQSGKPKTLGLDFVGRSRRQKRPSTGYNVLTLRGSCGPGVAGAVPAVFDVLPKRSSI